MIKKKLPKLPKPTPVAEKLKSEEKELKALRKYETLDTRAPISVQF